MILLRCLEIFRQTQGKIKIKGRRKRKTNKNKEIKTVWNKKMIVRNRKDKKWNNKSHRMIRRNSKERKSLSK